MIRTLSLCLLLLAAPAMGGDFRSDFRSDDDPVVLATPDEILLTDGTVLQGEILEELADAIVFRTEALGTITIPLTNIARIARAGERAGALLDPDRNSLMFCPTPETLPKGDSYFRDFELFFLNVGHALSDDVDLSVDTFFPFSSEVAMLSVGGKVRLADRNEGPLGLAVTGGFTTMEDLTFWAVGGVVGVGDAVSSLNLAFNSTTDDEGNSETVLLIGSDLQSSRRSKLFAEFMSSSTLQDDDDLDGFINVGVRIFGETHSFTLSGFRPVGGDSGSLVFFPMIMYSNHF